MRQIRRIPLPGKAAQYLSRNQARADSLGVAADMDRLWKNARATETMNLVLDVLRRMARNRERCMFCEDSRGVDVEHFWPKRTYRNRAFAWENLLLACAGCNRSKSDRFPLDRRGSPLLIDPTGEDPWDYLYCDEETGELAARWHGSRPHPKGVTTLSILPLRDHAITEGRRSSYRSLVRAVRRLLDDLRGGLPGAKRDRRIGEFRQEVLDCDSHGMGQWCFCRDGQQAKPFASLRAEFPAIWRLAQKTVDG